MSTRSNVIRCARSWKRVFVLILLLAASLTLPRLARPAHAQEVRGARPSAQWY